MIEHEKKMMLRKDEYEYLMKLFGHDNLQTNPQNTKQINYYFDTDDLSMNRNHITCRIRWKNGTYIGTLKKHCPGADLSTETAMDVGNGMVDNAFTDMGLKLQGELTTYRAVIWKDSDCEVVLDKNEYLGYTDYELEIEFAPEHEKKAHALLRFFMDTLGHPPNTVAHRENTPQEQHLPSKSARFFERRTKYGICS